MATAAFVHENRPNVIETNEQSPPAKAVIAFAAFAIRRIFASCSVFAKGTAPSAVRIRSIPVLALVGAMGCKVDAVFFNAATYSQRENSKS